MKNILYRITVLILALLLAVPASGEVVITILGDDNEPEETVAAEIEETAEPSARDDFIDAIIALAEKLYKKADGKLQRAQYSGDIYICKNFTVYLFRQTRDDFRMAEYPDVPLVIPDNLPKKECKDFAYGVAWKEISAEDGNPFYIADRFVYDASLSLEENKAIAREFLTHVKRGDYYQMSADYYYGKGAHSMIFISDYDPETDTVHWCDSNMRGEKRNGERYGLVQFDRVETIDFFVDAICHKTRGATLYRLRDDIIRVK